MKIQIEVEVTPLANPTLAQVQRDCARNLIEAVATAVSSGGVSGEHTSDFGSATYTVTPDAKPAKAKA